MSFEFMISIQVTQNGKSGDHSKGSNECHDLHGRESATQLGL